MGGCKPKGTEGSAQEPIKLSYSVFFPPTHVDCCVVLCGDLFRVQTQAAPRPAGAGMARDVPMEKVFRGSMPFLRALVFAAILLVIFPQIATFLPSLIK